MDFDWLDSRHRMSPKTIVPEVNMAPTNSDKVFVKPASIRMPTEPIGSIPRPIDLVERAAESDGEDPNLAPLYEAAIRDTIDGLKRGNPPNSGLGVTSRLPSHALHEARRPEDYVE
jgi:hypothetical protein